MSENQTLNLSNVITVSILPTPQNLGVPNINTAALISSEDKPAGWGASQAFAIYLDATAVGDDFGTDSKAYEIAVAFFAQNPNPLSTGGYLAIIPRTPGSPMETIQAAITRTLNLVYYFGILVDEDVADVTLQALADYVQTLDKMLFYCSADKADFAPGAILDDIRVAGDTHTRCLYYGDQPDASNARDAWVFAGAYAGRALSVDFGGSLTAQTMHLKQLATITPDQTMDQTDLNAAVAAGVDTYVSIAGVPGIFTSGLNTFFDQVYNEFALKFNLQTAGFNYLATTSTKIPQTEPGMTGLKDAYRRVLEQFVANGVLAPGSWTSPSVFGDPAALRSNVETIGYYVYSRPVAQQAQADREARKAPLVQIAAKMAGAIHSSSVVVNVNE